MSSSLRSRSWDRDEVDDDPAAEDDGIYAYESSDDSSDEYEPELESMTGKGIKRLCSELLELKRASDEDFKRNIHTNLSAFLGIFEEVGGLESELMTMKQHVLVQKKLVQNLMANLCLEIVSDDSIDDKPYEPEDLDPCFPSNCGLHRDNLLETLDILISEHRVEEALLVLESEIKTLQKLQKEEKPLLPSTVSYMSAISERRSRLADQFALVAKYPQVARPELQKALSGLCRLGQNIRANCLMLKYYRSCLERCTDELKCSIPFLHGPYIWEFSKVVFSTISQAARSFLILNGETTYTSELIKWAREETEAFSYSFEKYVKSISEIDGGIHLAVKATDTALIFCDLLKSQQMLLQPYLIKLIRPCIEEVLEMHMYHLKEDISIFTANETWALGKYLILEILNDSSFTGIGGEMEYCLLSISGKEFITLVQQTVDDIFPLFVLQTESTVLKGLTELFNDYIHTLENAIPDGENFAGANISYAKKLQQQISLLVNSSTLVYFFPTIAGSICKGVKPFDSKHSSKDNEHSLQNELDGLMLSILEAADHLRSCFCQRFVHEVMSHGECYSKASSESVIDGQLILNSTEVPMPSFGFQELFLLLRQLELSKPILPGGDVLVKMLLVELMETVVVWLSNNQGLWKRTKDSTFTPLFGCFKQVHIDMHFLLEIAKYGGYFSDDILTAALDLIAQIRETCLATELDTKRFVPDDEWASEAAKMAIEKLLEVQEAKLVTKEPAALVVEELSTQRFEDGGPTVEEDATEASDGCTVLENYLILVDGDSAESFEEGTLKLLKNDNGQAESPEKMLEVAHSSDEGLISSTILVTLMEDEPDEVGVDTMNEIGGTEGSDIEELAFEEGTLKLLKNDNGQAESPKKMLEVAHSGDEGLISSTILVTLMEDESDEVGVDTMNEIGGTEGSDIEELALVFEVSSVDNVTNRDHIVIENLQEIIKPETLEVETKLLDTSKKLGTSINLQETIQATENEVSDELDMTTIYSDHPVRTSMTAESKLLVVSGKMDTSVTYSNNPEGIVMVLDDFSGFPYSKADGGTSSTQLEIINLDFANKPVTRGTISSIDKADGSAHAMFEELVQVDLPKVSEGIMMVLDDLSFFPSSKTDGHTSSTQIESIDLDFVNKPHTDDMSIINKADSSADAMFEELVQFDLPRVSEGIMMVLDDFSGLPYSKTDTSSTQPENYVLDFVNKPVIGDMSASSDKADDSALTKFVDLVQVDLLGVSEGTMMILDDHSLFSYSEADGGSCSTQLESIDLDFVNKPVTEDTSSSIGKFGGSVHNIFEELAQVDFSRVAEETLETSITVEVAKAIKATSLTAETKQPIIFDNLNTTITYSNNSDGTVITVGTKSIDISNNLSETISYSDKAKRIHPVLDDLIAVSCLKVDGRCSSSQLEGINLDQEYKSVILNSGMNGSADINPPISKKDEQDDLLKFGKETTNDKGLSFEEEEPIGKANEAVPSKRGKKRVVDGVSRVEDSRSTASEFVRPEVRRHQLNHGGTAENLEKNKTAPRSTRRRWH